jgi:hypothetical protein
MDPIVTRAIPRLLFGYDWEVYPAWDRSSAIAGFAWTLKSANDQMDTATKVLRVEQFTKELEAAKKRVEAAKKAITDGVISLAEARETLMWGVRRHRHFFKFHPDYDIWSLFGYMTWVCSCGVICTKHRDTIWR